MDNGCESGSNAIVWDFDWTDVNGATEYQLIVTGPRAIRPIIDTVVRESSYRHERAGSYIIEQNRHGWRWKVRARTGTDWMQWSPERTFDVEPSNTDCR